MSETEKPAPSAEETAPEAAGTGAAKPATETTVVDQASLEQAAEERDKGYS